MAQYPRILIFGQPFNDFSGGGITLTNLFRGWKKDNIAVAYTGHGLYNVTTDVCNIIYQLGRKEHRWVFPFNLIQRKFSSGIKSFDPMVRAPFNFIQTGLRYKIVNRIFYPFLTWVGLFHALSKLIISKELKAWLSEYRPELLYLQVSIRQDLLFACELIDFLGIPSVIHIMDDWPSTISTRGILKNYWHRRIDSELRRLMDKVDLHLSISDSMSDEYRRRYGKSFIAFHNPIELNAWLPFVKKNFVPDKDNITILYSGRIGIGIRDSVYEVAEAIDRINIDRNNLKLRIQTPTKDTGILNQLKKYKCVVINPFAELEDLPRIFSEADILLLANDFSDHGLDFLRYSMPTKASEYMISGTPILVYSPEETAVSKFFNKNQCGLCVTKQDQNALINAIHQMLANENYRREISENAVRLARLKFNAEKVREEFQGLLTRLHREMTSNTRVDQIIAKEK